MTHRVMPAVVMGGDRLKLIDWMHDLSYVQTDLPVEFSFFRSAYIQLALWQSAAQGKERTAVPFLRAILDSECREIEHVFRQQST